jgi:hypothetical protein
LPSLASRAEVAHIEGTTYTLRMLYFACNGQRLYAGQEDLESRHDTKAACPE